MDTEIDLMRRLQSGDETALESLYDGLGRHVYALALEMLRNREDAEEVLQDVFVKLHRKAHRFDPERGSVRAYLYTIARNEARMRLRARRSRPKGSGVETPDTDPVFGAPAEDHDTRLVVGNALEHLPGEDVKLLRASFFHGYSHAELSQKTGLPLGTVKSRVRRALLKLREILVDA